jgi:predicted N-acyltransferase
MDHLQISVEPSISRIDPTEWRRLDQGRSLYQSHPWLSWAESNCAADALYVLARKPGGELVGAVPAYLLSGVDTSWNTWYDPLTVFAGDANETADRRSAWFPLLLVGSVSGYHSDVLVDPSLSATEKRVVTRELVLRCRSLADERGALSMAMMYVPQRTAFTIACSVPGATQPILTSANTRISASWPDLDSFLSSFTHRRRYNMQRELDVFGSASSRVVETRLSDCLDAVGPLLGNVHRRHGAADTDLVTTEYLRSQASHLDHVSTVFLELAGDDPVGFSLCFEWGRELYVRVAGFDYERSARFAYFALGYYLPLHYAMRRGLGGIHLGPGTYQAKTSRGAALDPTWSLVWSPDRENTAWFERVKQPGEDAHEAARWLSADLRAALTAPPIRAHMNPVA